MKKYELTDEVRIVEGRKHYRIRALRDIPLHPVFKGDLGGWVAHEDNLSQLGSCWVTDEAVVSGDAHVSANALVGENAHVKDYARVSGETIVGWYAVIKDHAHVEGRAIVRGNSIVKDNAQVSGDADISEHSVIQDSANVNGNAFTIGSAVIKDHACVSGHAEIISSIVGGSATVGGEMRLSYGTIVEGDTDLRENLVLSSENHPIHLKHDKDIYMFKNTWSSGRTFCYIPESKRWHVGCFTGTGDELIKKAYRDSKLSGDMYKLYTELVEKMEETK